MKRYILVFLCLLSIITIVSCGKKVNKLTTDNGVSFMIEGSFEKSYKLVVTKNDDNGLVNKVKTDEKVESEKFFYYNLSVEKKGKKVEITDEVMVTIGFEDSTINNYGGYSFINGKLTKLSITKNSNNYSFKSNGLGEYVIYEIKSGDNPGGDNPGGNDPDKKNDQLTKSEWTAFFSNLPSDYKVETTEKTILQAKGNSINAENKSTTYYDGDKYKIDSTEQSYMIIDRIEFLKYDTNAKFNKYYNDYNKAYGSPEVNGEVYTWTASKPKTESFIYEKCDDKKFIYKYITKDSKVYKSRQFIDEDETFDLDDIANSYDLATWVDDHYELVGPGFGKLEINPEVEVTKVNVIKLYFTDKKLTKYVVDVHIESEIENSYFGMYSESNLILGDQTIQLPETTYCSHIDETYISNDDEVHYHLCRVCESVVDFDEHTYDETLGICTVCNYRPTEEEDLEIDCSHMGVTVVKNSVTGEVINVYANDDYEYKYEDGKNTYTCTKCNFKILESSYRNVNYYKDLPCSLSSYNKYEFYKNGEKVRDDIFAVMYTEFKHTVNLVDAKVEDGKLMGYFECSVCHDTAKEELVFDFESDGFDYYSVSIKELNEYLYNIKLEHKFVDGYCAGCGFKEATGLYNFETGSMTEVTADEIVKYIPDTINYTKYNHYVAERTEGWLKDDKFIQDGSYHWVKEEYAYVDKLGKWIEKPLFNTNLYGISDLITAKSINDYLSSKTAKFYVNENYIKVTNVETYGATKTTTVDIFNMDGIECYYCSITDYSTDTNVYEFICKFDKINKSFEELFEEYEINADPELLPYTKVEKTGKEISYEDFKNKMDAIGMNLVGKTLAKFATFDKFYKTITNNELTSNNKEYYSGEYKLVESDGLYESDQYFSFNICFMDYYLSSDKESIMNTKYYAFDDGTYGFLEVKYEIQDSYYEHRTLAVSCRYVECNSDGIVIRIIEELVHTSSNFNIEEEVYSYHN